ncbi:MAG TPA: hypothetical protein VG147_04610 [Solirubrobacteraceae bacterium]|nr:hypothetical protein [Solirubrobacteraceae bacterium]
MRELLRLKQLKRAGAAPLKELDHAVSRALSDGLNVVGGEEHRSRGGWPLVPTVRLMILHPCR